MRSSRLDTTSGRVTEGPANIDDVAGREYPPNTYPVSEYLSCVRRMTENRDGKHEGIGKGQSPFANQNVSEKYQELVFTSAESATLTQTCT